MNSEFLNIISGPMLFSIAGLIACIPTAILLWIMTSRKTESYEEWNSVEDGEIETPGPHYGYPQLSGAERELYDFIDTATLNMKGKCKAKTSLGINSVLRVLEYVEHSPEYFWLLKSGWIQWEPALTYTSRRKQNAWIVFLGTNDTPAPNRAKSKDIFTVELVNQLTAEQKTEISRLLNERVSQFCTSANCKNIETCVDECIQLLSGGERKSSSLSTPHHCDLSYPEATAVGPILNGKGNSMGYSKAFALLMLAAGYSVAICSGEYKGTPHIWNLFINSKNERCIVDTFHTADAQSSFGIIKREDDGTDWVPSREYWFSPVAPAK